MRKMILGIEKMGDTRVAADVIFPLRKPSQAHINKSPSDQLCYSQFRQSRML